MKATSAEYAKQFCKEHGLKPDMWGDINNVACEGYHDAQDEIRRLIQYLRFQATTDCGQGADLARCEGFTELVLRGRTSERAWREVCE